MNGQSNLTSSFLGYISIVLFLASIGIWLVHVGEGKNIILFSSTAFWAEMALYAAGFLAAIAGLLFPRSKASLALCIAGVLCNGVPLVAPSLMAMLLVSH